MEKPTPTNSRGAQLSKMILKSLHNALEGGKVHPWSGARYAGIRYVRERKVSPQVYWATVRRMKKQGWIEEAHRQGQKFLKLTRKGKMQALLALLQENVGNAKPRWDGKWRVAIFDIPEKEGNHERYRLRNCLKSCGFYGLQKSVYVYPYEIPGQVVDYLRESGLAQFIRFLRADRLDDSRELERRFQLRKIARNK